MLATPLQPTARRAAPRFTLIELLVVVAVIAILASMLLPALSRARQMAQRADCASRQKQLAVMGHMYSMDADDQVLAAFTTSYSYFDTTFAAQPSTFGYSSHALLILGGYMPSDLAARAAPYDPSSLYLCPSATRRKQATLNIGSFYALFATQPELWPTNDGTIRMWIGLDSGSYAKHKAIWQAFQVNGRFQKIAQVNGVNIRVPIRESELGSNPADTLFWAEYRHDNQRTWNPSPTWGQFNKAYNERHGFRHPHVGGGNFAAYDGHVAQFDRNQFFNAIATSDQATAEQILGFDF